MAGMALKFVYNSPAAVLGDALLVADLHLGIEYDLQRKGYAIALQYRNEAEKINALLKETKAKQIIFLGDVKHDVYGLLDKEERMLNAFFRLLKTRKITVCKGNHDSAIENCRGINVEPAEGFVFEKTLLIHGHALPKKAKYGSMCLGHEHPLVEIKEGPHSWKEKAWIIGRNEKTRFVVFPHFGSLIGGRPFNHGSHLSPALTQRECDNADAYMLSGMKLGRIDRI